MAKGISGGGDDGGGNVSGSGGAASQAQKMSQVFLRNLPLAMLEPVRAEVMCLSGREQGLRCALACNNQ